MIDQKLSQATTVTTLIDTDYVPAVGLGTNKKISKADLFEQIKDETQIFIYPTVEQLQAADLVADPDFPTYVRVEETGYALYKITSLAADDGDISLDNGTTASIQSELSKVAVIDTWADIATTPAVVGQVFTLRQHTSGNVGGGTLIAVSGSVTDDRGTKKNSATAGIYLKRINYLELCTSFFGAIGDGATDDLDAIQAAIDACPIFQTVRIYGSSIVRDTINVTQNKITIAGPGLITAKAATSFENVINISSKSEVVLRDFDVDANKANRSGAQAVRYMGVNFSACTDCTALNVTVKNTRGYGGISAVAIAMAGGSIRGSVANCRTYNCGDAGFDSDGIFTSGEQNIVSNCQAISCTDVAFVIESSDYSVITGSTSINCAGGAAITNSTAADKRGNVIDGLTVKNWNGASTGGIQIGVPGAGGSFAGNLLDSSVSDVNMYADSSNGNGAAINVRQLGSGRTIGLKLSDIHINGSKNQGILVDGDDVEISDPKIKGTTDACIQFATGTTGGIVDGGKLDGGTYGVASIGTADISVSNVKMINQTQNGLYAFGTSNIESRWNRISGAGVASYGNDSGATISAGMEEKRVILPYSASISTNAALGNYFTVSVTNGTAFTINAPTNPKDGQTITYRIYNVSGGAMGAVTWNAIFKMPAYAAAANGFNRATTFTYSLATNQWEERSRTPSDIPN